MSDSEDQRKDATGPSRMLLAILVGGALLTITAVVVALVLVRTAGNDEVLDVATDDPVELGQAIYNRDCFGCHTTDGSSSVGPSFEGLYGSEVTMDDGSTVEVDDDHIREAIIDPRATTRDGYPDVMPPFAMLEDEEIEGLVAFIRSLE